jgi:replicative superfamily II helicase
LSGIGIYEPENFTENEMSLFLRNKDNFRFILSTPSIVYGTNISLSIIDVDASFTKDSTRNTLYQLIGRAGRKGKSHSATIIFRDNKMLNIIFNKETINIEACQIETNYQKILRA